MSGRKITIPNDILIEEVADRLNAGQEVILLTRGYSMTPFLRNDKDSVLLYRKEPAVDDIALARIHYSNGGNRETIYVLHRIIAIDGDVVTLMGDGNIRGQERCRKGDVLGCVKEIIRPDGSHVVPGNGRLWRRLLPIRRYLLFIYRRLPGKK